MHVHDVAVLGSGPAGCSAALYARRELLDVIVLEKGDWGGQIVSSSEIENYPGVPGTDGFSLMATMRDQALSLGAEFVQEEVTQLRALPDGSFSLTTTSEEVLARSVIACVGSSPSRGGFEGEVAFTGRGVSYCATCDGMFYRNKHVFVCGGGNSAAEEALFLSRFARLVTIVVRKGSMRADASLVRKLEAVPNIEFLFKASVVSVEGEDLVNAITLRNVADGSQRRLEYEEGSLGVFVYVGSRPNTGLLKGLVELDEHGYVITDERMLTSAQGIYAAGDCRNGVLKQVVTAAADGAVAAAHASRYLSNLKPR
ncbi:MAG: FAD-dependent oxidoreductase [Coriobacteriia bacterium]|nr:FAD-dependent oxidoreductase [Coriobacteriia bacterium]